MSSVRGKLAIFEQRSENSKRKSAIAYLPPGWRLRLGRQRGGLQNIDRDLRGVRRADAQTVPRAGSPDYCHRCVIEL